MTAAKEKANSETEKKAKHSPELTYRGKKVSAMREAITGDPGFKGDGKNDQAVITLEVGSEHTVLKHELKEAE